MHCALRIRFKTSNNEAEYEVLIAGLKLAKEMKVDSLEIFSDSRLVVCQITDEYQSRKEKMAAQLQTAKELLGSFRSYTICQIPRLQNVEADDLAQLALMKDVNQLKIVLVETLDSPSIQTKGPQTVNCATTKDNQMTPVIQYLKDGVLPKDKRKARLLRLKAAHYALYDDQLYKKGSSTPLPKCVDLEKGNYILQEIHEGICGNQVGWQSVAYKALRQGYFWSTMKADAMNFVRKCDKCQRFSSIPRSHPEKLTLMASPWPFAVQGIDLIGPMPTARPTFKYVVVTVDYFIKQAEAKPLAMISSKKVQEFIQESTICRFGILYEIVSDNGAQFDRNEFCAFYDDFGIKKIFSSIHHPQTNGKVEVINKIIKFNLKTKLEERKGLWAEELSTVLLAYKTTS